mgnify:FL=1
MRLISHRGNLDGPQECDNVISTLEEVSKEMLVEVDVWYMQHGWYLGHDGPERAVSFDFIANPNFILHAKNLQALCKLTGTNLHYFWHQEDDFTLTSKQLIWTYPRKEVTPRSIIVCQTAEEAVEYSTKDVWGICTDFIKEIL